MKMTVTLKGFDESETKLRLAGGAFQRVVKRELQVMGDDAVTWLKTNVKANTLGLLPKKRPNGKPPLIDTENYINSYIAEVDEDGVLSIYSVGMNKAMSNEDLAELLEYGWSHGQARPHLRLLVRWIEVKKVDELGQRIVDGLGL